MKRLIALIALPLACGLIASKTLAQSHRMVSGQPAFFSSPPRLLEASSTFDGVDATHATYFFTLAVPDNAGQPLHAIRIEQAKNLSTVQFENASRTHAFKGTRFAQGAPLPLASIGGGSEAPGETTVVFEPPVQPGQTVTVALRPVQNPRTDGVYLFGVTAYPQGEGSRGQFLGFGRIHFYSGG